MKKIISRLTEDLHTVLAKDPSIRSTREALFHPNITAIWSHRVARRLYLAEHYATARLISNVAKVLTGIEIHPGATIGRRFFVDHGAAVVIGETCVIGDDVMLYHQVTLGSVGWWQDGGPGSARHPILRDGVIVGTNASVLGPIEIGRGAQIAAHAVVTRPVLPGISVHAAKNGDREAHSPLRSYQETHPRVLG
jgi:serine O-acetyltransferase